MSHAISIDFGTTNTVIARWSEAGGRSELIRLDSAQFHAGGQTDDGDMFLIPSRITYEGNGIVKIGRHATDPELNERLRGLGYEVSGEPGGPPARSYHSMKREVLRRTAGKFWTVAAADFLREVLRQAAKIVPPEETRLVMTFPVEAKNDYCRFLDSIARDVGFANLECISEPIAAAMGIGQSIRPGDHVLVVDCGGGTTDVAWVCFEDLGTSAECVRNIATACYSSGGNDVDDWVRDFLISRNNIPADINFRAAMQKFCRRIKEGLSSRETIEENLLNPVTLESYPIRVMREDLRGILDSHDFYHGVYGAVSRAIDYGMTKELEKPENIRHVYFTGGSSQLPGLVNEVSDRLKRRIRQYELRVVHNRPFTAVARGAAARANGFSLLDTSPREYYLMDHRSHDTEKNLHRIVAGNSKCPRNAVFNEVIELLPPFEHFFQVDVYEISTSGETDDHGGDVINVEQNRDWINRSFSIVRTVKVTIGPNDRKFRLVFDLAHSRQLLMTVVSLDDERVVVAGEPLCAVQGGVRA